MDRIKIAGEQGNDCNIRYLGATTQTRYMKSKSLGPTDWVLDQMTNT